MLDNILLMQEPLKWNIPLLLGISSIILIYVFLFKRFASLRRNYLQPLLFLLGCGLLYVTIGSPLSSIIHLSFTLHMVQMSILYFIVPPLILLGIPPSILHPLAKIPKIKQIPSFLFSANLVLYSFAILLLMYHLPFVLTFLSKNAFLQSGYLFVLFVLSFGMWLPIASPNPKQRLNKESLKRYAFRSGLILMPACALFILTALMDAGNNPFLTEMTAHLCLPDSSSMEILPAPFNTKYDQFAAGFIMLMLHKIGLMVTFKLGNKVFISH